MMPITEQTIAEFAGIVGDTLPREGESARVGGELEQIIRSAFPIRVSEASFFSLASPGDIELLAPTLRHHALGVACMVTMTLRGVTSAPQRNYLPAVPLPVAGVISEALDERGFPKKVSCKDAARLGALYRKLLATTVTSIQKRLRWAETGSAAETAALLPHDVWSPG